MKKIFIKLGLVLSAMVFIIACSDDDDFTGQSTQTATSPSLTVSLDFDNTQSLVEMASTYGFTVTLSEPQIVNVVVNLAQVGGTATRGDDFDFPSTVVIPKGATSASDVISILSDDIAEGTETAAIQIGLGNEANVSSIGSQTVDFTIMNVTAGDLAIGLDWTTTIIDASGAAIDPHDAADLRLLITPDNPYTSTVDVVDGSGAESYVLTEDSPDGEYFVIADFFQVMDLGAQGFFDVGVTATYDQVGVYNHLTHNFDAVLNSGLVCEANYFILSKIIKTGATYTIESVGENSASPFTGDAVAGTYDVVSNGASTDGGPVNNPLVDFASTVTIADNGDGTFTVSDGWAGVYIDWYNIYGNTDPEPQTFSVNQCGAYSASWTGIFGGSQEMTGTVNGDGTITVRIDNSWGDFVDQVYTMQ